MARRKTQRGTPFTSATTVALVTKFLSPEDTHSLMTTSSKLLLQLGPARFWSASALVSDIPKQVVKNIRRVTTLQLPSIQNTLAHVTNLSFHPDFNTAIPPGTLPQVLTRLRLGSAFDQPLDGVLPDSLRELRIDNPEYTQPIPALPHGLLTLVLSAMCTQQITRDHLPDTLTALGLGVGFNQSLAGLLPRNLQEIRFGIGYGGSFTPDLFAGLEDLRVVELEGPPTGQIRKDTFPPSVEEIIFAYGFDQPLSGILPLNLTHLDLGVDFNTPFGDAFTRTPNLRVLDLGFEFNKPLGSLPKSLKSLELGYKFNQPLGLVLPHGLEGLDCGYSFNKVIGPNELPTTLVSLLLSDRFNKPIKPGVLPPALEELCFGSQFDQDITPGTIPPSVTQLAFGMEFNRPLGPGVLPRDLTHLELGDRFFRNNTIELDSLPLGLVHVVASPPTIKHLQTIVETNLDRHAWLGKIKLVCRQHED